MDLHSPSFSEKYCKASISDLDDIEISAYRKRDAISLIDLLTIERLKRTFLSSWRKKTIRCNSEAFISERIDFEVMMVDQKRGSDRTFSEMFRLIDALYVETRESHINLHISMSK